MHRLLRRGAAALALAGLVLCLVSLQRQWQDVRPLEVAWSPGWLAVAVLAAAAADVLAALGWAEAVRRCGGGIGVGTALRVWWTGQLARFVPTGLGSLPGRAVAGTAAGLPRRLLVVTTTGELAVAGGTSAAAAALLLPGVLGPLGLGAGLAAGAVLTALLAARLLPGTAGARSAGGVLVAAHTAKLGARTAGLWAVLQATTGGAAPSPVAVLGAVGAAYALGLLAVFAPGGIGVRETALAASLGALPGAAPAAVLAAALVWRLMETAVQPPLLLATRLLPAPRAPAAVRQP